MTGLTDYTARPTLDWLASAAAETAPPASLHVGLFTAVGTDAGTGFVEASGPSYARVQVAGSLATSSPTAAGISVINFASLPAWVRPGMSVHDTTTPGAIPAAATVAATGATTVTLSLPVTGGGVLSADSLRFSAFLPASGTAPSSVVNGSAVTFPAVTGGSWGSAVAHGLFDAPTGGNLLEWDFLSSAPWAPFTATAVASGLGSAFTAPAHGLTGGALVVVTAEYFGALPTVTQGALTGYALNYASVTGADSFTLSSATPATSANALWTSTSGSGVWRQVVAPLLSNGAVVTFAPGTLSLTGA